MNDKHNKRQRTRDRLQRTTENHYRMTDGLLKQKLGFHVHKLSDAKEKR